MGTVSREKAAVPVNAPRPLALCDCGSRVLGTPLPGVSPPRGASPGSGSAGGEGQPFPKAFRSSPGQGSGLAVCLISVYHRVLRAPNAKRAAVRQRGGLAALLAIKRALKKPSGALALRFCCD